MSLSFTKTLVKRISLDYIMGHLASLSINKHDMSRYGEEGGWNDLEETTGTL